MTFNTREFVIELLKPKSLEGESRESLFPLGIMSYKDAKRQFTLVFILWCLGLIHNSHSQTYEGNLSISAFFWNTTLK